MYRLVSLSNPFVQTIVANSLGNIHQLTWKKPTLLMIDGTIVLLRSCCGHHFEYHLTGFCAADTRVCLVIRGICRCNSGAKTENHLSSQQSLLFISSCLVLSMYLVDFVSCGLRWVAVSPLAVIPDALVFLNSLGVFFRRNMRFSKNFLHDLTRLIRPSGSCRRFEKNKLNGYRPVSLFRRIGHSKPSRN